MYILYCYSYQYPLYRFLLLNPYNLYGPTLLLHLGCYSLEYQHCDCTVLPKTNKIVLCYYFSLKSFEQISLPDFEIFITQTCPKCKNFSVIGTRLVPLHPYNLNGPTPKLHLGLCFYINCDTRNSHLEFTKLLFYWQSIVIPSRFRTISIVVKFDN